MKLPLVFALFILCAATPRLFAQSVIEQNIKTVTAQMDQLKVDIEKQRLLSLQAKAKKDLRSAASYDATLKQKQNLLAVKQATLTMYQQQLSLSNQKLSDNTMVAGIQVQIQQLTIDKSRLAISQLQATQVGNTAQATAYQQQIAANVTIHAGHAGVWGDQECRILRRHGMTRCPAKSCGICVFPDRRGYKHKHPNADQKQSDHQETPLHTAKPMSAWKMIAAG